MPLPQSRSMQALPQQPLNGIQILLVEDELDIADLLLVMLQYAGATVRSCREAETALATLTTFQPDIVVADIKLPSHDGIWLIQQIRHHPCPKIRSLPAMGVTSYHREVHGDAAIAAGFNWFLSKLDSPNAIVNTISTLAKPPC